MTLLPNASQNRKTLRQEVRQRRRSLSPQQQSEASSQLCKHLISSEVFRKSQHIALFLAADGEVNLQAVLEQAVSQGKHCYLPAVRQDGIVALQFYPYQPGDKLIKTPLGVLEPNSEQTAQALTELDLVLTPLVAFDSNANRMGMGKGYYDRSFDFKRESPSSAPILLGVAHECQKVDTLESEWWDVPLDGIQTPERLYGPLGNI